MQHYFKNLNIWKRSTDLVQSINLITKSFPSEEKFGLINQLRRATVSVPSNIAEGFGREGDKELIQFCQVLIGSHCEVETQLTLSSKLEYITKDELEKTNAEAEEVRKMIYGFVKSIKND